MARLPIAYLFGISRVSAASRRMRMYRASVRLKAIEAIGSNRLSPRGSTGNELGTEGGCRVAVVSDAG